LLLRNITCFSCHEHGHVAANCKNKKIKTIQQNMQQTRRYYPTRKQRRTPATRYINSFYCYYYMCHEFGHKVVECKVYMKKNMNAKRNTSFSLIFGHTRCFVYNNLRHKAKDCKLPYILKTTRQKIEATSRRENYERNGNKRKQSTKVWKRKRKEQLVTSMPQRRHHGFRGSFSKKQGNHPMSVKITTTS